MGGVIETRVMTRLRRVGTDQRGGEISSAGVIDESENLPRGAAFARLPRGLQTPRSFTDGSEPGQLTAPMNPESTLTSATRHSGRSNARVFGLMGPGVSADCPGQSE